MIQRAVALRAEVNGDDRGIVTLDPEQMRLLESGGYSIPNLPKNSVCARFHRWCSKLVTLTRWSRSMST